MAAPLAPRGGHCGWCRRHARAALLELEHLHHAHECCGVRRPGEHPASGGRAALGVLAARGAVAPPVDRYRHRHDGRADRCVAGFCRWGSHRYRASARVARRHARPARRRDGGHLFRLGSATALRARPLGIRRHRIRRVPRGVAAAHCRHPGSARTASVARARHLRRAGARSHAAWAHGAQLGSQALASLRGEPHPAR